MRENKIEGVPSKEAKVRSTEEANVEDKKTKVPAKEKSTTEMKSKVES